MQYAIICLPGRSPGHWTYSIPEKMGIVAEGDLCLCDLKGALQLGFVMELNLHKPAFVVKEIHSLVKDLSIAKDWFKDMQWVARHYHAPLSKVLGTAMPKWLLTDWKKELAPSEENQKPRKKKNVAPVNTDVLIATNASENKITEPTLNLDQQTAVDNITSHLPNQTSSGFKSFLLHGVTGSGKTLVYLTCARNALQAGKNVLVLLPEIALTPQLIYHFSLHLNVPIHSYHSGLTDKERKTFWVELLQNRMRVIVGVRSAIMLPLQNMGLVVIDEEHDGSYKQTESAPRYHARDLALIRARTWSVPIVLGSATPSLETYQASQQGKHTYLTLPERATKQPLPALCWVNMCDEFQKQGNQALSSTLRDAITETLGKGNQAILLLNRRGYSRRRLCKKCGEPIQCTDCSCNMIPHLEERLMRCHHCGKTRPIHQSCSTCHHTEFTDVGIAIEQLETHLKSLYPMYRIERLDRDTSQKAGALTGILDRFRSGETHILLGTQMVAKGHDFPKVQLVGIVDADTGLSLPDFRTQERLYQLLVQVAGRAGRHEQNAKVVIQTFNPNNPLFTSDLQSHRPFFYNDELELRKTLLLPPFSRFARLEIEGTDEGEVKAKADTLLQKLQYIQSAQKEPVQIRGPAFPLLRRLKKKFRVYLLLQASSYTSLHPMLSVAEKHSLEAAFKPCKLIVDMDPQVVV